MMPTCSSRMRLPALGARGSMSVAGTSRSVAAAAPKIARKVTPRPTQDATSEMPASMGSGITIGML